MPKRLQLCLETLSQTCHARARQAHQTSKPRGHPLSWSGPHAAELRTDEETNRGVERDAPAGRYSETGHLPGIRGRHPLRTTGRYLLQQSAGTATAEVSDLC